eukprot:TRINITY_DN6740_c0_g1_i1.p1 TRINITY_DN6740_c0_g1~~TRINITY_DN6740_c0_g1_i1.p1  ORF type:complete len:905 (+),score=157.06 TRINITY_DN6740_c0_g1_i1:319-2715(+)
MQKEMYERLFPYQREGIKWLWSLYRKKFGGVLGDDMGLGKTVQVVAFLICLFSCSLIKRVLILAPVSVMEHWRKTISAWSKLRVEFFHGTSKAKRETSLQAINDRGGFCISSYGMVLSSADKLSQCMEWDYMILDEGHKIKNPNIKLSKVLPVIRAKNKVVLTGTPIQNNLQEMWSLFNYACSGKLLGTYRTFKKEYEDKILRGNDRTASNRDKEVGLRVAEALRAIISPYFLRREKAEVFGSKLSAEDSVEKETIEPSCGATSSNKESEGSVSSHNRTAEGQTATSDKMSSWKLTVSKHDFICWVHLSELQKKLYHGFLSTPEVQRILSCAESPLAAITLLKKICDHPRLLHKDQKTVSSMDISAITNAEDAILEDLESRLKKLNISVQSSASSSLASQDIDAGIKRTIITSGKMQFLVHLLRDLKTNNHRVLIFSMSTKMLDIIQLVMQHEGYRMLRMDGSIPAGERQKRVDLFNQKEKFFAFLMTTNVGGLGITLTGADRAILFDPSWNTLDDQAVDRIYRIGQKKDVVIYRLITCGTIEEKIYRKQVFKQSLMRTIGKDSNQYRYFSSQELSELFALPETEKSITQIQLEALHSHLQRSTPFVKRHVAFLKSLGIFGVSDHTLLFSIKEDIKHDEDLVCLTNQMLSEADEKVRREANSGKAFPQGDLSQMITKLAVNTTKTQASRRSHRTITIHDSDDSSDVDSDGGGHQDDTNRVGNDGVDSTCLQWSCGVQHTHEQVSSYNQLVLSAWEEKEKEKGDLILILHKLLQALAICDHNPQLSLSILLFSQTLGFV